MATTEHNPTTEISSPVLTPQSRPPRRWPARVATAIRITISLLAIAVISGSLYLIGLFLFDPEGGEEVTIGLRPNQFYAAFDPEDRMYSDESYGLVYGGAHNSGARTDAILEALVYGADLIEVDVVEVDGVLRAAHTRPLPIVGQRWFRGPTLEHVWTAAYQADAIKLDLKETTPKFVGLVVEFINSRPEGRPVLVASRETWILRALRVRAPQAILLKSVADAETIEELRQNQSLVSVIDGITVRHSLLDEETAVWLQHEGLLVFAWTVNDMTRVNELMALGIDGVTSDNLAILNLLGGQKRSERDLPLPSPP
jgi:glycerophosphoryl diester phosphodiesterase